MGDIMADDAPRESWHLDKKVPIALIATLIVQAGGFVWFASKLDARVDQQASRLERLEAADRAQDVKILATAEGVIRLQEQLAYLTRMVERLVEQADRRQQGAARP
jgi:Tfp pilus assembly protein PilO